MNEVKLMQVIFCTKSSKGQGIKVSPYRTLTEIYTTEGQLLASADPLGGFTMEDMISFATEISRNNALQSVTEIEEKFETKYNCIK